MTKTSYFCTQCEDNFELNEGEEPYRDDDTQIICDDCHREFYEFECCFCADYTDQINQHNMIVVFEDVHDVTPGIYEIIDKPYYWSAMIDAGFFSHALVRIGDVPKEYEGIGYPSGHLCMHCQELYKPPKFTTA